MSIPYNPSPALEKARSAAQATHERIRAIEAEAASRREAVPALRRKLEELAEAAVTAGKRLDPKDTAPLQAKMDGEAAAADRLGFELKALESLLGRDLEAVAAAEAADLVAHEKAVDSAKDKARAARDAAWARAKQAEDAFAAIMVGFAPFQAGAWAQDLRHGEERRAAAEQKRVAKAKAQAEADENRRRGSFAFHVDKAREILSARGEGATRYYLAQSGQHAAAALEIASTDEERAEAQALLERAPKNWEAVLGAPAHAGVVTPVGAQG